MPEEVQEQTTFVEGATTCVSVNAYERSPAARTACITHHGYACAACGLNLGDVYGQVGAQYIHVHHLRQLSEIRAGYEVNPTDDLCPVCPNCHAIIHRRTPPYTIAEVKAMLASST
jgi:predicted HNH restriction endonuclease